MLEVVQDGLLHGHVECRGRLVGDKKLRASGQADTDERALAHTTGELVRVLLGATLGVGKPSFLKDLHHALPALGALNHVVGLEGFLNLGANTPHRVQVGHWILRDQADLVAAEGLELLVVVVGDVLALEEDLTLGDLAGAR